MRTPRSRKRRLRQAAHFLISTTGVDLEQRHARQVVRPLLEQPDLLNVAGRHGSEPLASALHAEAHGGFAGPFTSA